MAHPGKFVQIKPDPQKQFQTIDGFGVNINARYFDQHLLPAMNLLRYDLGATLFRVDIWGKSNWIDPDGSLGQAAMDPSNPEGIYQGTVFQRGWGMMRWLNEHGIQPYLTASGIVPPWMLDSDGKSLVDYESFTDMLTEMLVWAKKQEKLDFHLFGPLNETDLGDPEGPTVLPQEYTKICELLIDKLDRHGLTDMQLVVAEQARFDTSYVEALTRSTRLQGRIGAFALHTYGSISPETFAALRQTLDSSTYAQTPLWMSEFGDLEQSGEHEWWVAWVMASRLFDLLEGGFQAAMVWDAYDNYHDHNEYWTLYGLLRTGLYLHTPKKRYYAMKQVFRFVPPAFHRIEIVSDEAGLRLLAFTNTEQDEVTLIGMYEGNIPLHLNLHLPDLSLKVEHLHYLRSSEDENCQMVANIPLHTTDMTFNGVAAVIPPACIFTLTSISA